MKKKKIFYYSTLSVVGSGGVSGLSRVLGPGKMVSLIVSLSGGPLERVALVVIEKVVGRRSHQ